MLDDEILLTIENLQSMLQNPEAYVNTQGPKIVFQIPQEAAACLHWATHNVET